MLFDQRRFITRSTPLLITSAIKASAPFTNLIDSRKRLFFLVDSIRLWAATGVEQIVVCDGSTSEIGLELSKMLNLSAFPCRIEVLGFVNSVACVERFGKGYGEGEIIKYAITHSKALSECAYFVKCTGKLFVTNYWRVTRSFNGDFGASSHGFAFLPQSVDTRFYITSKKFFLENLADAYLSVNDPLGIYLENVYFAVLCNSQAAQWLLTIPPKIIGVSGSSGLYNSPEFLYLLRLLSVNIFSLAFNIKRFLLSVIPKR